MAARESDAIRKKTLHVYMVLSRVMSIETLPLKTLRSLAYLCGIGKTSLNLPGVFVLTVVC